MSFVSSPSFPLQRARADLFPSFYSSFRPYFEAGAVDIVQPDVSHAGGISECKRIADFAATYDV